MRGIRYYGEENHSKQRKKKSCKGPGAGKWFALAGLIKGNVARQWLSKYLTLNHSKKINFTLSPNTHLETPETHTYTCIA